MHFSSLLDLDTVCFLLLNGIALSIIISETAAHEWLQDFNWPEAFSKNWNRLSNFEDGKLSMASPLPKYGAHLEVSCTVVTCWLPQAAVAIWDACSLCSASCPVSQHCGMGLCFRICSFVFQCSFKAALGSIPSYSCSSTKHCSLHV